MKVAVFPTESYDKSVGDDATLVWAVEETNV